MNTYWEDSVKKHLRKQKRDFFIKISETIPIFEDTSQEMIDLLIEIRKGDSNDGTEI
ncbi:hypothetical protein MKY96_32935 [Paenibacillus sp. FSL R7-0302]|uniref:hypothetical protein n=1 Tax=Paenibacillus sp. FSL R7-0302 TaxID=2921681 RepID=UPI0030FA4D72